MVHVLTDELRDSVLNAAITGKISKTLKSDTNIHSIDFDSCKFRDNDLQKRLKKIKEDSKNNLQEIPSTWRYVYLGQVLKSVIVPQRDKPKVFGGDIPWCRIEDLDGFYLNESKTNQMVSEKTIKEMNLKVYPVGTVLSANSASIGATAITTVPCCTNQTFVGLVCSELVYNKYLQIFLRANKRGLKKMGTGTTISYISQDKYISMHFPLPPIEEQTRIVAKVDELMAKIDEYEKLENELVELKKNFPGDMKAAALQAAMQGKLTEQLKSDSNVGLMIEEFKKTALEQMGRKKLAKNKTALPINEDEYPFDIPETWEWVRFGNLVKVISGTSYDKTSVEKFGLRIIRGGNLENLKIVKKDDDIFLSYKEFYDDEKVVKKNDIVVVASTGSITGIGRSSFVDSEPDEEMQIGAFLRIIRPYKEELYKYCKYIFMSNYYRSHISNSVAGIGIRNLKEEHITALPIPLPPIEEQQRIVEKLDQLLPMCDELANLC